MNAQKFLGVLTATALVGVLAWGGPETMTCALSMPSDGGSITTTTVCTQSDGGVVSCGSGTCSWAAASNVMMQCNADVYVDQDGNVPDAYDTFVDFTNQLDPFIIQLVGKQKSIGVSLVTAATGKVCKFGPTMTRKSW